MSDARYTWIKLYTEVLHDRKMAKLSDRLWRRAVEVFLLAGNEATEGVLPSVEDMAWDLRCDENELEEELRELSTSIGLRFSKSYGRWVVTHFADRQAALSNTDRSRKFRASNSADVQGSVETPTLPSIVNGKPAEAAQRTCNDDATKTLQGIATNMQRTCNEIVAEEEEIRGEEEKKRKEGEKKRGERAESAGDSLGKASVAAGAVGFPSSLFDVGCLLELYSENVGELTPPAEHWVKTSAKQYGVAEVENAIRVAVLSNVKSRRYMDAILIRREKDKNAEKEEEVPAEAGERVLAERIVPPDPWAHLKDGVKTPLPGKKTLEPGYIGMRRR